jgi:TonB-linked SusC/RagA family outer membrane protein
MQKRILLFVLLSFAGYLTMYAQTITGKVTSSEDKLGIPGVNIVKKGTTIGTITDLDGLFSIQAAKGDILTVSFLGMTSQEIVVKEKTYLEIELSPQTEEISEVVVTALGLKRDEKALGYAIQKVSGDEIAKVKELDVVNALSGKVAGVNIIQADGSIGGGGSRIVIRGESSLAGNNDPLFIINGIQGSANDVAADDIESISVLKGPAAAALYGSKAGGGVVIITSKSGKGAKGTRVEFNSNSTFQSPLVLPKYQNQFGQGEGGQYSYFDGNGNGTFDDTYYNWGPAFDGQPRSQFTGNDPWVAHPNNVKDFYQLGHIFVNNVSLIQAAEKSSFRFSYTNTDQRGILPNTGLQTNRFDLNSDFKLSEKLQLTAGLNYNRTYCPNDRQVDPRFEPRNIDFNALKNYWVPGMEGLQQLSYRRSTNNPYFILNENQSSYNDNKVIFNLSLQYNPVKDLTIIGRYGNVYKNNEYYDKNAYSTYERNNARKLQGYYKNGQANTNEKTAEFLATYTKNMSVISAKFSVGGTHYRVETNRVEGSIEGLMFTDLYNLNNRLNPVYINNGISKLERNSLYSFLNLDYRSKVYLDITARNDWSSTLHPKNNSFFYPSFALSGLMNEIFTLPKVISFWKIRGSWAQVGKDIAEPYFITPERFYWSFNSSTGEVYPYPGDTKTDPYLKPELTTGKELGTDIRLFNNRLGLDIAVYKSNTTNQILKEFKSIASGGQSYFMVNAGEIECKGIEATVNIVPVRKKDIEWNVQLNWSLDRTSVLSLLDSIPNFAKSQKVNSFLFIEDRVGQRRGTFYGQAYERTPDGGQLFSLSGDTRLTGRKALGNYNPDWMASFSSDLRYRNFTFSFLLDLRYGGLIYNEIERKLNMYGLSEASAMNNREGIVPDGYVQENGSYRKLTLADLQKFGKANGMSGQEYWANMMEETCPENELIDDTYLKLREARIAYDVPKKFTSKLKIQSLTVALVGRNLAVFSKVKHIDPETFGYASEGTDFGYGSKVPGYAVSSMPSVRSYGFTLNIKF